MSHDELALDLAAHLRGGSQRVTWCDMQLGPSGSPRPDVYTMEPTYTRLTFEAFEVKVSVPDFRSDVTSGKWQKYLKFANKVTFAVPAGLVRKEDVPATCGLIVRHPSGWKYAKKPTSHVLTEMPWQAWIKLLLDGVERTESVRRAKHFSDYAAEKALAKRWGAEAAKLLTDIQKLPREFEWRKAEQDRRLEAAEKAYKEAQARIQEQHQQSRLKCDSALQRLAVALGMEGEPTVDDLNARATRLSAFLAADPNGWRRGPLLDMAQSMERLAAEMRALCGNKVAAEPETAGVEAL